MDFGTVTCEVDFQQSEAAFAWEEIVWMCMAGGEWAFVAFPCAEGIRESRLLPKHRP